MNKVKILVDSCADLTAEMYKKYDIDVVAQNVIFGETTYKDNGQEITLEIEQQYHQYTENELRDIVSKLYYNNNNIEENMDQIVEKVLQITARYSATIWIESSRTAGSKTNRHRWDRDQ